MSILALVKFFRNLDHLDALLRGVFRCNAPETYRLSGMEGVSDKNESCIMSFREARGDPNPIVNVEGVEVARVSDLTVRWEGTKDMWLHCWVALEVPKDPEGLEALHRDLVRLRSEFGPHYATITKRNIMPFVSRLRSLTSHKVLHGRVRYSGNVNDCFAGCKMSEYEYQREYRFGLGECHDHDTSPLVIEDPTGFGGLIHKNAVIEIRDQERDHVSLHMDQASLWIDTDA